ncbi:hypothetical protein WUBG_04348 [Wuchereria bancrofti]|uniref:Uncharacterized protein n=1 Tax=Wuchereria bancrofti TaxID=6293 RepID=J9ERC1_WUCBA|nr:hypothetical protein WUBG_04348 [Wuchereria bancrofti]
MKSYRKANRVVDLKFADFDYILKVRFMLTSESDLYTTVVVSGCDKITMTHGRKQLRWELGDGKKVAPCFQGVMNGCIHYCILMTYLYSGDNVHLFSLYTPWCRPVVTGEVASLAEGRKVQCVHNIPQSEMMETRDDGFYFSLEDAIPSNSSALLTYRD